MHEILQVQKTPHPVVVYQLLAVAVLAILISLPPANMELDW